MKNYIQPGKTISLAAPYAVTSGDGLLVGAIFGIAVMLGIIVIKILSLLATLLGIIMFGLASTLDSLLYLPPTIPTSWIEV